MHTRHSTWNPLYVVLFTFRCQWSDQQTYATFTFEKQYWTVALTIKTCISIILVFQTFKLFIIYAFIEFGVFR